MNRALILFGRLPITIAFSISNFWIQTYHPCNQYRQYPSWPNLQHHHPPVEIPPSPPIKKRQCYSIIITTTRHHNNEWHVTNHINYSSSVLQRMKWRDFRVGMPWLDIWGVLWRGVILVEEIYYKCCVLDMCCYCCLLIKLCGLENAVGYRETSCIDRCLREIIYHDTGALHLLIEHE